MLFKLWILASSQVCKLKLCLWSSVTSCFTRRLTPVPHYLVCVCSEHLALCWAALSNAFLSAQILMFSCLLLCVFNKVLFFFNEDYLHLSSSLCRAFGSSHDGAPFLGQTDAKLSGKSETSILWSSSTKCFLSFSFDCESQPLSNWSELITWWEKLPQNTKEPQRNQMWNLLLLIILMMRLMSRWMLLCFIHFHHFLDKRRSKLEQWTKACEDEHFDHGCIIRTRYWTGNPSGNSRHCKKKIGTKRYFLHWPQYKIDIRKMADRVTQASTFFLFISIQRILSLWIVSKG